ncbi:HAD family hydrolase [Pseudomonas sp. PSE14]|uniref:D-glycero-alpha-D-manno-heptose-1,7-bisphosphate 7-phosphatase n=1 Tax=Pseudomonas sp. PSE14 TaxID=3016341 RepID=UPI0023D7E0D6|nr:HAD family hydrolase [Pseudomonas sp. PSE14]WEJ71904.1 HAD family hydrolase [Pseudomonas sp. PSE14]
MNKALFLDRDGVINVDYGYVYQKENFTFNPDIFQLVHKARERGYLVIIVTNQAGIGRGYYSEEDFLELMDWVSIQFNLNSGRIDKTYYCPFHPKHGVGNYLKDSFFRKPNPGMLLEAEREFSIDMKQSLMIGDNPSDMEAGFAAGVGKLICYGFDFPKHDAKRIDSLSQAIGLL